MPRVKRKGKRRSHGYCWGHYCELEEGHSFEFIPPEERFCGDRDAQRAGWEDLRETIMAKWVKEHPGTRPWAWWEFDAPERRRVLGGKPHPFDNPERWRYSEEHGGVNVYALYYGMPRHFIPAAGDEHGAKYETQPVYLVRLGLLTPEERDHPDVKEALARGNNI